MQTNSNIERTKRYNKTLDNNSNDRLYCLHSERKSKQLNRNKQRQIKRNFEY